ncbi:MAG: type II toxin-antitoxin system VapC family toxin, partial [Limnospira sp.]
MILLDTHAWLWLLHDPEQLSPAAREAIAQEENQNGILISSISVWEVAVKHRINKLQLPLPIDAWFELARQQPGTIIEPLSPLDAINSTTLYQVRLNTYTIRREKAIGK